MEKAQKKVWKVAGDESCDHDNLAQLGADKGNNEYYMCQDCGASIIKEGSVSPEVERERMEREREEEKSIFDKFLSGST